MSYVSNTVVIRQHRATVTLSPDGTAQFKNRVETSTLPPSGWVNWKFGSYFLEGGTAVITWTESQRDTFSGDGASWGFPERKAHYTAGEKPAMTPREERVDGVSSGEAKGALPTADELMMSNSVDSS